MELDTIEFNKSASTENEDAPEINWPDKMIFPPGQLASNSLLE